MPPIRTLAHLEAASVYGAQVLPRARVDAAGGGMMILIFCVQSSTITWIGDIIIPSSSSITSSRHMDCVQRRSSRLRVPLNRP